MAGRGSKPGERRGGRALGTPNRITADIKAVAQQYGEEAITTLVGIMRGVETPPQARVAAAKEILDRGYGKSIQVPPASNDEAPPLHDPNPGI